MEKNYVNTNNEIVITSNLNAMDLSFLEFKKKSIQSYILFLQTMP